MFGYEDLKLLHPSVEKLSQHPNILGLLALTVLAVSSPPSHTCQNDMDN